MGTHACCVALGLTVYLTVYKAYEDRMPALSCLGFENREMSTI